MSNVGIIKGFFLFLATRCQDMKELLRVSIANRIDGDILGCPDYQLSATVASVKV